MIIDLKDQKLPPIYVRQGRECYLDPIRKKLIFITPEEKVRQQIISYLLEKLEVPPEMIRVEEHLSHYGAKTKRRADIIVEKYIPDEEKTVPMLVIECKAPTIVLGNTVEKQMTDYVDLIGCEYAAMCNGYELLCYHIDKEADEPLIFIEELPKYLEMIRGDFVKLPKQEMLPRLSLEEIEDVENWKAYIGYVFGDSTDMDKLKILVNLYESLIYTEHKMPVGQYKKFRLIEDYGLRLLQYGNAGGGQFWGWYRSFLIDYKGSTEFISIGSSTYATFSNNDRLRTIINVAVDNEKESHHALQYLIDDNLELDGKNCMFYHHGRIGVGNKGAGKIDELKALIREECPSLLESNRIYIGTLVNDHIWNLDEPDMIEVVDNLISYALIRDEYRNIVKNR